MRRRLMLKSSTGVSPVLPAEYQRVEYIENNAGAYIQTSFILPQICEIRATVQVNATASNSENLAIGCQVPETNNYGYEFGAMINQKRYFSYAGTSISANYQSSTPPVATLVTNLTPTSQTGKFILDGVEQQTTTVSSNRNYYSSPIFLFNNSFTRNDPFHGKIFNANVLANNEYVLQLIPCYRKADNEIGMYDTVSQTFYINAGTGTFTKGADV